MSFFKKGSGLILAFVALTACENNTGTSNIGNTGDNQISIAFVDVTEAIGLTTEKAWKYGGPSIADFDDDGRYDLIVSHHNGFPAQLFWANDDGTYREDPVPSARGDVHGFAPGDYDGDGDTDYVVALGGGNGTTPQPPRLMRNDGGQFTDVTEAAGIAGKGARGRSPRWVDMDLDGDLDLLQIAARQAITETGPRNIVFRNDGDGTFTYHPSGDLEQVEAERVLVTDFNGDGISDLVAFPPVSLWRGNGDMTFTDVSDEWLPDGFDGGEFASAVADIDFDNDGDRDLYIAQGKTYYQLANNSVSYNEDTKRLDLRDEGNASRDGLGFVATGEVSLGRFWHWPRGMEITLPVHLGNSGKTLNPPPSDFLTIGRDQATGWPENRDAAGWYVGYLGENQWRMEWHLPTTMAWGIRGSVQGIDSFDPDFEPHNFRHVPDMLLRNEGGRFSDVTNLLPSEVNDNNWGVTHGDFNNDGFEDLFVYRFGELSERVPDLLMMNRNGKGFDLSTNHGATELGIEGHGDMGAAFDFNLDGRVDLLSGDDQDGYWRMYRNATETNAAGNFLLVRVGYSEAGVDPLFATLQLTTPDGQTQVKDVASAGAVHSQSLLSIVHFGIGTATEDVNVTVTWRDGTQETLVNLNANQLVTAGNL